MTLGLCSQIDLDIEVQRASRGQAPAAPVGDTLLPASMTETLDVSSRRDDDGEKELDADAVFAKLSSLKRSQSRTTKSSPQLQGGSLSRSSIDR